MIRFGLGLITVLLFTGCFQMFDPGTATKVKTALSPKKDKQAILFQKDGNATEADSYQVSIKQASDKLDDTEVGNTLTVDDDHGNAWLNPNSITHNWIAENTLLITYDKKLRYFIQNDKVDKVAVIYDTK